MSDLQDALDQIKARFDRSKWEGDAFDQISDLELSQADVPRLVAAIEAVMEKATYMTRYAHSQDYWGGVRAASEEILAALNDKLAGEDDEQ